MTSPPDDLAIMDAGTTSGLAARNGEPTGVAQPNGDHRCGHDLVERPGRLGLPCRRSRVCLVLRHMGRGAGVDHGDRRSARAGGIGGPVGQGIDRVPHLGAAIVTGKAVPPAVPGSAASARRAEPRSVAAGTAAGAGLGLVGGHGAQPVHLHGAAVGEQVLELAAGPLDP